MSSFQYPEILDLRPTDQKPKRSLSHILIQYDLVSALRQKECSREINDIHGLKYLKCKTLGDGSANNESVSVEKAAAKWRR